MSQQEADDDKARVEAYDAAISAAKAQVTAAEAAIATARSEVLEAESSYQAASGHRAAHPGRHRRQRSQGAPWTAAFSTGWPNRWRWCKPAGGC